MNVAAPRSAAPPVARVRSSSGAVRVVGPTRRVERSALVALAAVVAVHLVGLSGEFAEVPYLGVAWVALITASAAAGLKIARHERRGWWLAGVAALAASGAYVASRTAGLPAAADEIGAWGDPLGVASLVAEALVVALASRVLAGHRTT